MRGPVTQRTRCSDGGHFQNVDDNEGAGFGLLVGGETVVSH